MTSKQYESVAPHKVAFLGLGVMGYPMAGHLKRAGHSVTVYNRTMGKAADWATRHGGGTAPTPREAAAGAVSRKSRATSRPSARWMSMKPPPPRLPA